MAVGRAVKLAGPATGLGFSFLVFLFLFLQI
jgi:hypothetical protein